MKIKPCPFCGKQPEIEYFMGTSIGFVCPKCGCEMFFSKSDYLSREEESTWNNKAWCYSDEVEKKIHNIALAVWNKRV